MKLNDTLKKANESALDSLFFQLKEKIDSLFMSRFLEANGTFNSVEFQNHFATIKKMIEQIRNLLSIQENSLTENQYKSYSNTLAQIYLNIKKKYEPFINSLPDGQQKQIYSKLFSSLMADMNQLSNTLINVKNNGFYNNEAVQTDKNGIQIKGTVDYINQQNQINKGIQQKIADREKVDPNQLMNTKV